MSRTFRRKGYEETQNNCFDRVGRKIAGFYTIKETEYRQTYSVRWGVRWSRQMNFRAPSEKEKNDIFWSIHRDGASGMWLYEKPWKKMQKWMHRQRRQLDKKEIDRWFLNREYEPILMPVTHSLAQEYYD